MECLADDLLSNFVQDPDAVVDCCPGVEEHLESCARCRSRLDELLARQNTPMLCLHVLGDTPALTPAFPEINGYRVEERISSGGYGTVFRGVQLSTGRLVAIKFIFQASASRVHRLALEQAALMRVDHPHIVALIDAGSNSAGVFIVYAWMETNLSWHLKSIEPAELADILNLLVPICEAVCHLHSHGIIHRDIKPSNVLLSARGQPKLADFGLVKDLSEDSPSSTLTEAVGTPGYMAPEQTGLVEDRIGYETDVYGLGALMYAMTAGRPPFQAANNLHVIHQVLIDMPVSLRRLRPDVSMDYETVCMKCLSKRKADRYSSATELLADLKRLQCGERVLARPISLMRKTGHWLSRRPAVRHSLVAMIAVIAICLASFFYIHQKLDAQARASLLRDTIERLLAADELELQTIYESLNQQPRADLSRELLQSESDVPVKQLRLALANRWAPLSWNTLLCGIDQCDIRELPLVRAQLESHIGLDDEAKEQLNRHLRQAEPESVLRVAAACPANVVAGDAIVYSRLLLAVSKRSEAELSVWQQALEPYADELTAQLLVMLDAPNTEGPMKRSWRDLLHATKLTLLWNKAQPKLILGLLERSPHELIAFLRQHPQLLTTGLRSQSLSRWQELMQLEKSWYQPTENAALNRLASDYWGAASTRGGYLGQVPAQDVAMVLQSLHEEGYGAISAYRLMDREVEAYSICFRNAASPSELSRYWTPEDVVSSIDKRREQGWYPASVWVSPGDQEFVVLWTTRKDYAGTLNEYPINSTYLNSESFASRCAAGKSEITFAWNDRVFGFERTLSIATESQWEPLVSSLSVCSDKQGSNIERSNFSRNFFDGISLERFIRSARYQQFTMTGYGLADCQQKARELLRMGFLPSDCFVDGDYRLPTFFDIDRKTIESSHTCRATCALVCWLCGDIQPLLSDIHCQPYAFVRGALVGELKRVSNIERLFQVVAEVAEPDQINALLVASAELDWSSLSDGQRSVIEKQLRELLEHVDSGVHFAAKWILESRLGATVDLAPFMSRSRTTEHRSWFYSGSGIPFVVIHPRNLQVLAGDCRTPWTQRVLGNAFYYQEAFAISAVEISQKEVSRFQGTSNFPAAPGLEAQQLQQPANTIDYGSILSYCCDLNEAEGFDASGVRALTVENVDPELTTEASVLRCRGYRLPTSTEWEIACRCGAVTSTFFGDNLDYLSSYAWNSANTELTPMPVGTLAPSPWGLHDILGNVYEANLGDYRTHESSLYARQLVGFGYYEKMGINIRGGSFLSHRVYCTSGVPHSIPNGSKDRNSGFRIVRSLLNQEHHSGVR